MLAHLFRKCGGQVRLDDAVYRLAFVWRYGSPTIIRKILALATEKELISFEDGMIKAGFVFTAQKLDPNQTDIISREVTSVPKVEGLY